MTAVFDTSLSNMKKILIFLIVTAVFSSSLLAQDKEKFMKAVSDHDYKTATKLAGQDARYNKPRYTLGIIELYLKYIEQNHNEETNKGLDWLFSLLPDNAGDLLDKFRDLRESTLLHTASTNVYSYAIQKLLEKGASPFVREDERQTPYDMAYNSLSAASSNTAILKDQNSVANAKNNALQSMELLSNAIKKIELEALKDPTTALFFYAERLDFEGISNAIKNGGNVNAKLGDISSTPLYKHLVQANHTDDNTPLDITIRNSYIQPVPYQQKDVDKFANSEKIIEFLAKNGATASETTNKIISSIRKLYDRENVPNLINKWKEFKEAENLIASGTIDNDPASINKVIKYLSYTIKEEKDNTKACLILSYLRNCPKTLSQKIEIASLGELTLINENYVNVEDLVFNEAEFRTNVERTMNGGKELNKATDFIAQLVLIKISEASYDPSKMDIILPVLTQKNGIQDYLYEKINVFPEGSEIRSAYSCALLLVNTFAKPYNNRAVNEGYVSKEFFYERNFRIDSFLKEEANKNPELKILYDNKGTRDIKKLEEIASKLRTRGL